MSCPESSTSTSQPHLHRELTPDEARHLADLKAYAEVLDDVENLLMGASEYGGQAGWCAGHLAKALDYEPIGDADPEMLTGGPEELAESLLKAYTDFLERFTEAKRKAKKAKKLYRRLGIYVGVRLRAGEDLEAEERKRDDKRYREQLDAAERLLKGSDRMPNASAQEPRKALYLWMVHGVPWAAGDTLLRLESAANRVIRSEAPGLVSTFEEGQVLTVGLENGAGTMAMLRTLGAAEDVLANARCILNVEPDEQARDSLRYCMELALRMSDTKGLPKKEAASVLHAHLETLLGGAA